MNRTELAIIDSFWQLLEEKPYNKITVKNIVEHCQVNRNTFYYHFQDIPDLLERVIKKEVDDIIQKHDQFLSPSDCLYPIIQLCMSKKKAILNIYHSIQRDVFLNNLEQITFYFINQYVNIFTENLSISSQDKKLFVRFYKSALVGIVLDWLEEDMTYDLGESFKRISHLFTDSNERALLKATIKSD